MSSNRLARVAKVLARSLVAIAGSTTMACNGTGVGSTTIPGASPTPTPNSFVLANNTSTTPESFTLKGSGTVLTFYGTVTVSGSTATTVDYSETAGFGTNACPIAGKTVIETIYLTFYKGFSFAPNGSFGTNTGLLDTQFSTTATGPFTGAIYQYLNCGTAFSPAQSVVSNSATSYEYPGGGNTSIPAGTYIIEIWH